MKTLVSLAEAKAHLEKLLERASHGEEIVIVENGVEVGAIHATSSSREPVVSSSREPVVSSSPAPVVSSSPAPVVSSSPAPVVSSSPAPVVSSNQKPSAKIHQKRDVGFSVESYGAARTVTGSNHWLRMGGQNIMLDCGQFQGSKALDELNDLPWAYKIGEIDGFFLSHAHLDHTGRLPKLVRDGYNKPIYATPSTREIVEHLLLDSAKIQNEDWERDQRKNKQKAQPPLFTEADVQKTLALFEEIEYNKPLEYNGLRVTAQVAGHIPGSASLLFESGSERFVFSGDLGNARKDILPDPTNSPDADIVLMESTYGDRDHKPFEQTLEEFAKILHQATLGGGKVLIPSFALERTQDLLYHIARLEEQNLIPTLPVFVDSPLASRIEATYAAAKYEFEPHVQQFYSQTRNPFEPRKFKYTASTEESKALNSLHGPAIVIAGAGMLTGGRILHHLRNNISNKNTSVVIVGYQPQGGLGRMLIDGADRITLFGESLAVKASIYTIGGFSAHADQTELLDWSSAVSGEVRLVHGEIKSMDALKAKLEARGQRSSIQAAMIPVPGDTGKGGEAE
jgi:metallo-beta-lactamase family protein